MLSFLERDAPLEGSAVLPQTHLFVLLEVLTGEMRSEALLWVKLIGRASWVPNTVCLAGRKRRRSFSES